MKILIENVLGQNPDLSGRTYATLAEAVDDYCPPIKINVEINDRTVSVNPCLDLYGLHEDGLDLVESLAFDRESTVGYPEVLPRQNEQQKTYGIFLTEGDRPRILVCRAERDAVHVETRTLIGGAVVKAEADEEAESNVSRAFIVLELGRFLLQFMKGLEEAAPQVASLDDYKNYIRRVSAAMDRAAAWGRAESE